MATKQYQWKQQYRHRRKCKTGNKREQEICLNTKLAFGRKLKTIKNAKWFIITLVDSKHLTAKNSPQKQANNAIDCRNFLDEKKMSTKKASNINRSDLPGLTEVCGTGSAGNDISAYIKRKIRNINFRFATSHIIFPPNWIGNNIIEQV